MVQKCYTHQFEYRTYHSNDYNMAIELYLRKLVSGKTERLTEKLIPQVHFTILKSINKTFALKVITVNIKVLKNILIFYTK